MIKFHGVLKNVRNYFYIISISWDKLCVSTGTFRNKVLTFIIIFIPVRIYRLEFLSVVSYFLRVGLRMVTSADCSYLDPRTRRDSSESTSSLAEKGRASAAVQHSSRSSQRLGMTAARVTMVPLSQETAWSCNRHTFMLLHKKTN
jgi:hypothetical protein